MSKTIVIGDTHGRSLWKEIVKELHDKVIFIGDYFDTHDNISAVEQLHNFKEIIEFKKTSDKEVILLVGNHDYHYGLGAKEVYSGYQSNQAWEICIALSENLEHLQMAYQDNDAIFTHAGITKTWCRVNKVHLDKPIAEQINELFKYTPNVFKFTGFNPYGDNVTQSCIWVRPDSLQKDRIDYTQVVGHTQVPEVTVAELDGMGVIYYIDTLGTSKEYLIIEDGKFSTKKL